MTSPSNHTPASAAWEPPGSAPRRPNRTRRDRRDDRPRHNERRPHARDLGPDARHLDPREGRRSYDPRTFDLLPASSHGADPYDERAINRRTHRGYSRRSDFEPRTEHGLPRREERQADRRSRRRDLGPDARHLGPTSSFNRRTATDNTPDLAIARHGRRTDHGPEFDCGARFDQRAEFERRPKIDRRTEHQADQHPRRHRHNPGPFGPEQDAFTPTSDRRTRNPRRQRDDHRPDRTPRSSRHADRPDRRPPHPSPTPAGPTAEHATITESLADAHRALHKLTHAYLAALTSTDPTHHDQARAILATARQDLRTILTTEA